MSVSVVTLKDMVITELLDMPGASCEVYKNGQTAVDALARSPAGQYQGILMDVRMPLLNFEKPLKDFSEGR